MKRLLAVMLTLCFLVGCGGTSELDSAMTLRSRMLSGSGCKFDATIIADYGDRVYTFQMQCTADQNGDLQFTVTEPESIRGITGKVSQSGGGLTFDDKVLAFPLLADGQVTPVSAPWLFVKTLRSGYITGCGSDGDAILMSIRDSYAEESFQLDIWTDSDLTPTRAQILWQNRRILSVDVKNFTIL